ncbi:hypothetical protein [Flavobacterium beibuense]|uniref:hypothetical protein n=1 Tax=Flavobacterium beibuense TaxID=657326 RepID=UPI003A8D4423
MKKIVVLIAFLLIAVNGFSQVNDTVKKYECDWNNNLTVEQRNAIFSFSEAKKVMLISYANFDLRYTS